MDIPSPAAGKIAALKVKVGDRVSTGSVIATLETAGAANARPEDDRTVRQPTVPQGDERTVRQPKLPPGSPRGPVPLTVVVPDLGDFSNVEIIDVLVKPGDD